MIDTALQISILVMIATSIICCLIVVAIGSNERRGR